MAVFCKLFLKLNKVDFGKSLKLKGYPFIYNKKGATLSIGDNCVIKSSFLSNLVGLYSRTIIVTRCKGANITIGNNVGMSGVTIYARKGVSIGDNTCIGGNTKILDNDFHPLEYEKRNELLLSKAPEDGEKANWIGTKEIKIGKNCFIGCNALILKGTELGDGCVVGAGAVVSGTFEAGSVIAGNPAKVIKMIK